MCWSWWKSDDTYTAAPYRPANEKPHHSVPQNHPRRHPQPQSRSRNMDPSREEVEKQHRQAQARAAAHNYGWPTTRGVTGLTTHPRRTNGINRDSVIEPQLASGLAAIPGSDFRAVYDPNRARHLHQQQHRHRHHQQQRQQYQHQQQYQYQQPFHQQAPTPTQQQQQQNPTYPQYHQQSQSFVHQQPSRMAPMRATAQIIHQQAPVGRKPVLQPTASAPVVRTMRPIIPVRAQTARFVDENGVSDCSSDDEDDDEEAAVEKLRKLREYTVSPLHSPDPQLRSRMSTRR